MAGGPKAPRANHAGGTVERVDAHAPLWDLGRQPMRAESLTDQPIPDSGPDPLDFKHEGRSSFYWLGVATIASALAFTVAAVLWGGLNGEKSRDEVADALIFSGAMLTALGVALAPSTNSRLQREAKEAFDEAERLGKLRRLPMADFVSSLVPLKRAQVTIERAMVEASHYATVGAVMIAVGATLQLINPALPTIWDYLIGLMHHVTTPAK